MLDTAKEAISLNVFWFRQFLVVVVVHMIPIFHPPGVSANPAELQMRPQPVVRESSPQVRQEFSWNFVKYIVTASEPQQAWGDEKEEAERQKKTFAKSGS